MIMVGCYEANAYRIKKIDLVGDYGITTIEYQGCEYVVMQSHFQKRGILAHKGNCRFCVEHRKQELKEMVEQLKNK